MNYIQVRIIIPHHISFPSFIFYAHAVEAEPRVELLVTVVSFNLW